MRLNNHGWGLKEMLLYSGILILFLGLAVFLINVLYGQFSGVVDKATNDSTTSSVKTNSNTYQNIEHSIQIASISYVENFYNVDGLGVEDIVVSVSNLTSYDYISQPRDIKDNKVCDGYAIVKKTNGALVSTPYLNCSNYTTANFQEWRIGG